MEKEVTLDTRFYIKCPSTEHPHTLGRVPITTCPKCRHWIKPNDQKPYCNLQPEITVHP